MCTNIMSNGKKSSIPVILHVISDYDGIALVIVRLFIEYNEVFGNSIILQNNHKFIQQFKYIKRLLYSRV